jgi:hypothetical protein
MRARKYTRDSMKPAAVACLLLVAVAGGKEPGAPKPVEPPKLPDATAKAFEKKIDLRLEILPIVPMWIDWGPSIPGVRIKGN